MSAEIIDLPDSPYKLIRAISDSDSPELVAQSLPAQTIHTLVTHQGLESSLELLETINQRQYSLVLDLDLWQKDELDTERFFNWLSVLSQDSSLRQINRFVIAVDAQILQLLICRHVSVHYSEEPTDLPPNPGFYTPDRGQTWIHIRLENEEEHNLLARVLAIVFQTNTKYFYQLLSHAGTVTSIEHEEECYRNRCRRLWDEGIPDPETCAAVNRNLTLDQIRQEISTASTNSLVFEHRPVPALFARNESLEPLTSVLAELSSPLDRQDAIEGELAFITNSAIIYFGVTFGDLEAVSTLVEQVRGALNIGLETIKDGFGAASGVFLEQVRAVGLTKVYQVGLAELRSVSKLARSELTHCPESSALRPFLETLAAPLPLMLRPDPLENGKFYPAAISTRAQLAECLKLVKEKPLLD